MRPGGTLRKSTLRLLNDVTQRSLDFFKGVGHSDTSLNFGHSPLNFILPGSLDFRFARAIAILEKFPYQPVEFTGRRRRASSRISEAVRFMGRL